MKIEFEAIGIIHTPFKEKFAIPRQPGLAGAAKGEVRLSPGLFDANCLRGIDQFSHLWLLFHFHQTRDQGWAPLVRPPRLGGNDKLGVFATRSTFRPNSIGMSVVELVGVRIDSGAAVLDVAGVDLLDGTPILDIKPYLPYVDALPEAKGGFAAQAPTQLDTEFSQQAQQQLQQHANRYPDLAALIRQVLAQDPRPAYQKNTVSARVYGMALHDLNIQWQVINNVNQVIDIQPADIA